MIERVIQIDKSFFIAINNGLANPFFDWLCPILRNQSTWYILYVIFIYFIIKKYGIQSWKILLSVAIMIVCSDQFSANLIKNTFQRIRPCSEPSLQGITRHLISSCNGFSFISAHATNHFAIAVFVSFFLKSYSKWIFPLLLLWASSIAFSQVYVGVHYPLDVFVGAIIGSLIGFAFSRYTQKYITHA
ncbi:MAG: phosphatase PAP2 family protein [Bacteroidetes bacterium]|nr:phosphatase PAP2 family protein [Bacteroidota bacterium]